MMYVPLYRKVISPRSHRISEKSTRVVSSLIEAPGTQNMKHDTSVNIKSLKVAPFLCLPPLLDPASCLHPSILVKSGFYLCVLFGLFGGNLFVTFRVGACLALFNNNFFPTLLTFKLFFFRIFG